MNVLADDNELLKYVEMWNKIVALFNKKLISMYIIMNK